jgi:enoyl-CoA hydratase/carnithine racemase
MSVARVAIPETLCPGSITDLTHAIARAVADASVDLLVLKGSPAIFCRGLDIEHLVGQTDGSNPSIVTAAVTAFANCLNTIRFASKATLARIEGEALGGGVGLAAACDVVVAGENATFALPELLFGLTPATILPVLLNRMPPQRVRLWALRGETQDAGAAREACLVDEVVAAGDIDTACRRWERALRRADPRATAWFKNMLVEEIDERRESISRGVARTAAALAEETVLEPLRAFWRDGTPPWEGR